MNSFVLYATKKGSSEIYAKEFARKKNRRLLKLEQSSTDDITGSDKIYYFGSVYAGKVLGLEELKKKFPNNNLTVFPVGLSSSNDQEKLAEIHDGIISVFPQAEIIHLRGRLIKDQLNLPEKLIIKMISKASKKKTAEDKLDIEQAIEQAVDNGSVDYIDLAVLEKIK